MKTRKSGLVLFISGTVYIIGMAFVADSFRRDLRTSSPVSPGSIRSRTTRSGISLPTAERASVPVAAVSTRKPSRVSWYAMRAAMSGSSSTTRTRLAPTVDFVGAVIGLFYWVSPVTGACYK